MRTPLFNDNEFLSQDQLNAAAGLVSDSLEDITYALHTPGLVGASNLSFSYSGLNISVSAPLPFRALFSDGTLASANGTTDGSTSSSATVDFSSLVPSTGSITAYLVATSGSVAQEAFSVVGPPVGHPDFSPSYQPYTAYAENQDTIQFQATTTEPDNLNTLFIASTVLSAGQTVITSSSTVGQVRAGAILSRNGEVLAADLGSGAAASNVGTLGGSLVGTLPNPTLSATGATSGTYINPVTITVDEDGRISDIANVSNWNVPGNVTAGGTIVASGTATAAAATSPTNLIPYGQAFQLLQPTASESITLGNVLHTVVQPSSAITADIAITLEPGSVGGQDFTGYGSISASGSVTYQTNVTTGTPYIELPDGSQVYSWTIPAGAVDQSIYLVWDGTNWRARTFGQTVVAPATQNNAAVQLGQAFQLLTPTASETITLGNTLETVVQPSSGITADITLTLEPGSVAGQKVICYGAGSLSDSVTIQSNVTTGSPALVYPDNSANYSWTIPTGTAVEGIILTWDGANWRAKTFGQEVVAPATQNNAAVQLGQVLSVTPQYNEQGYTPASGDTYTISNSFTAPCNGFILAASTINMGGAQPIACDNSILINGTKYGGDSTPYSMTNWGAAAVNAGTACTVTSSFTAGSSTGTFNSLSQTVMSIFIPNP